jgi:putative ABC transport system permease protein
MGFDRWRYVLPLRLRSLFRSTTADRELDEELRDHIERQTELNIARGMRPPDARQAAVRAMGGVEQHKEACRDQRRVGFAENLIRDMRYGLRLLSRTPIFTAVAILSLALGIGANAAIFQLIDTLRLRTLRIASPHQLAEVRADGPQAFGNYDGINSKATSPLWELIRANQSAFSGMFAWADAEFLVGRGVEARRARGLWVSGDFFPVLGITPQRGRLLGPSDDRRGCGADSAVVSHAFWQTQLGARESAIGSSLTILDQPFTVVGVAPASFTGLEVGQTFDVALPVCSAELLDTRLEQRDHWWLTIMGRLKPDWTIARADEHLRTLSPGFLDATIPPGYHPGLIDGYRRLRFGVVAAGRGVSRLRDRHGTYLSLLQGLTGLVLLITCANLATLMLARASAREREIAVRVAIGASRPRVVSQILIESLLVAAGGAALAVPVGLLSARALVAFLETSTNPVTLNLTVDWRLVMFVGAVGTLAAVVFGLVPALRVSMVGPIAAIRQASRGSTVDRHRARFQRGLVVAQIAVSLVLVFSALLFVQTFRNLAAVDTGFETDRTLAVMLMDRASQDLSADRKVAFQGQLTNEIRSIPGVAAAAASTHIPLSGSTWSHFFRVVGVEGNPRRVSRFAYVGPGYFDTLKIPLRSGRDFTDLDTARSRRVMLVNESFVRSHLAGLTPIGTTLRTLAEPGFPETTYEIIGVVGDTKYANLREENCWCPATGESTAPIAYVPIAQNPSPYAWAPLIVRSSAASAGVSGAITQRIGRLHPGIAIQVVELKAQVRERLIGERMIAWLAGTFGILAMALVTVGLYGLIAYLAVSRRHEIGIRLSLGSTRAQIVALLLRDNLLLLGAGLAIGLPLAVVAMRGTGMLLFGLSPTSARGLGEAMSLLAAAGLLAAALPAWRAARVRLDEALRCE